MAREPYTVSTIQDASFGLGVVPPDDGYNIIGAVYSPSGPLVKTKVSSQDELIRNYLTNTLISPSDHISLLYAYKVLERNPVYIIRGVPLTILEGITCSGTRLLFNKSFKLIDQYTKFKIDDIEDPFDYYYIVIDDYVFITGDDSSIPAEVTSGKTSVVISPVKSIDTLIKSIKKESLSIAGIDIISSEVSSLISKDSVVSYSSNISKWIEEVASEKYSNISLSSYTNSIKELDYITINGVSYYYEGINIEEPFELVNPVRIESPLNTSTIDSPLFFLKVIELSNVLYSGSISISIEDGSSIKQSITMSTNLQDNIYLDSNTLYLANNREVTDCHITIVYDTEKYIYKAGNPVVDETNATIVVLSTSSMTVFEMVNAILYSKIKTSGLDLFNIIYSGDMTISVKMEQESISSNVYTIVNDTDSDMTYTYITSNDENNKTWLTYTDNWIRIQNKVFYVGLRPTVPESGIEYIKLSSDPLNITDFIDKFYLEVYKNYDAGLYKGNFIIKSQVTITSSSDIILSTMLVNQSTDDKFAIIQKFPTDNNIFKFEYGTDPNNSDILNLILNYKEGTSLIEWSLSFKEGVTDAFGNDLWYTRVTSDYFSLVDLGGDNLPESYISPKFGINVSVPTYNIQYLKDAVQSITGYEDKITYDIISDLGVIEASYASIIQTAAIELNSLYPASIPPEEDNVAELSSYVSAAGLNNHKVRILAAGDRVSISGFSKILAGSIKIIQGILDLFRNTSLEFAPHFGESYGVVSVSNLTQEFTKEQREALLEYKIAALKGGSGSPFYINDNTTAQTQKSYLSEDQSVRLQNTIAHIVESHVEVYKSEFNTRRTRELVTERLDTLIRSRVFGGKFTPEGLRIVCDESNNPNEIIDSNQLVIDVYISYYSAIKFINIFHKVVPIGTI